MYDMVINYGTDIFRVTYEALENSSLASFLKKDAEVMIKPNMVMAKPPSSGATTHAEVVAAIIEFLRNIGVTKIKIAESASVGENTKAVYRICGFDNLFSKYGVELVDLKQTKTKTVKTGDLAMEIYEEALNAEFIINVPVLKAHCQTNLTCNMKNLKGLIPDSEKRRFHSLGLHKPIAVLNKAVKTSFCVVDGICGDINFEEGGNPIERNMIIAAADPVLADSYCASLLGYEAKEIGYLKLADEMALGKLFDNSAKILELNADKKPQVKPANSAIVKKLSAMTDEKDACSVCYSALICALHKEGLTFSGDKKIKIGQGFRGKGGEGIGVGNCTKGFSKNLKGCPPKANEVAKFLRNAV
ncbi:MAG: DUF362 domain-containing protein [Clostridiales bacterium]|jgi:uncharacterized protein (DUF362 family)|nr:DUF362 domain-containing protein [Clostridiales bacterium]